MGTDIGDSNKGKVSYLQPEILSAEFMTVLLNKLGASSTSLNSLEKKEIVRIFCKHLTPKPQRFYNDKRFSKILLKNQKRLKSYNNTKQKEDFQVIQLNDFEKEKMFKHKRISAHENNINKKKFKSNIKVHTLNADSRKRIFSDIESPSKKVKIAPTFELKSNDSLNKESSVSNKKTKKVISWP